MRFEERNNMLFRFKSTGILLAMVIIIYNSHPLQAQQKVFDFRATDSLTLKYYLEGQWDSLLAVGKASNLDYYYLNARMGYAWFAKQKFGRAIRYFKKALRYNSTDPFSLEYFVYSSTALGYREQTMAALAKFTPSIPAQLMAFKPYSSGGVGGGILSSTAPSVLSAPSLDENANIYGESSLPGNGNYLYGQSALVVAPGLIIEPGLSILKTQNPFRAATADTLLFSTENPYIEKNLHLGLVWVPSLTWAFKSYFRFSGIDYKYSIVTYNPLSFKYNLDENHQTYSDFSLGSSLTHYFGDLILSTDASWHTEYDSSYAQLGIYFYWYPFSDTRLIYGGGICSGVTHRDSQVAAMQTLSLRPLNNLWITGTLILGNASHKSFADAWVIYNADYKISRVVSLSIFSNLMPRLSASLQWNNLKCMGKGLYFKSFTEIELQDLNYFKNSLSLSIYWRW